jgi:TPR repeat protein
VPKNDKKAFTLMQKSARQGAAKSQNSLAMMYFKGIGVKANYQSAYTTITQRFPLCPRHLG